MQRGTSLTYEKTIIILFYNNKKKLVAIVRTIDAMEKKVIQRTN
jgi:hypothetical protein